MVKRIDGRDRTNRSTRILSAGAVLALSLTASLRSQELLLAEPVPSELLRGGELIVPTRNFAIATPAGDWQWFVRKGQGKAQSQETYICRETDSGAEFQVISTGMRSALDAKFVKGFKEGVQESLAAGGRKVVSLEVTESAILPPHSYRCQWHTQRPDGQELYGYGYLAASDTVFSLQHITTDATEPPIFTQFASTFRGLRAPVPHASRTPWLVVHFLLLGVACIVAGIVNCVSGRVVLNGGTIGAGMIVILIVILTAVGEYAGVSANLPPEKLGEIIGRRIGEAFVPLLIAVFVSRAYRKRQAQPTGLPAGGGDEPSREAGSG